MRAESEKRGFERFSYPARIEYVLEAESPEIFKGVTINISRSGLGIYAFSPLAEGEEILIQSNLPVDQRKAVTCWIRQEHGGMYKIGLRFANGRPEAGTGIGQF